MHRERRINRRQQGDLGEASAIEWLTRQGATVFTPLGHSPDVDLVADFSGEAIRVQVKTSTQRTTTPDGHERYPVVIATNGGNQSWSGLSKRLDPAAIDFLFALTVDGRRWFLPSAEIEARNGIQLGGPKYSEFEIDPGSPIGKLVHGDAGAGLEFDRPGEYPSGLRMAAVNRPALPSQVRILPPPSEPALDRRIGRTRVSANHQVTIPKAPFKAAELEPGDLIRVEAVGEGSLLMRRIGPPRDPTLLLCQE